MTNREGKKLKRVRKLISLVLIVTMVTLNLPLTVFAGENEALNRFKEYNKEKISLYPYLVEMYKYGTETTVGPGQYAQLHDGREVYLSKEPALTKAKYKISWLAFRGDRALAETELYEILGLEDVINEAAKANKRGKNLFYAGLIALGAGFIWLTTIGNSSETPSASSTTLPAVLAAAGAFAAYFGNRMMAVKTVDYIEMYKMVQRYNLQSLAGYFDDVNVKEEIRAVDKIRDLDSLLEYEYRGLEIKDEYKGKDFDLKKIKIGMTKEEVLAVCGTPFVTSNYKSLASWEYVVENQYNKMFDFGRLTGESFSYTIYTLYFEHDWLVDWTEQEISSEK